MKSRTLLRTAAVVAGAALVVIGWWGLTAPSRDFEIVGTATETGVPVTIVAPRFAASDGTVRAPGVVIAHGFGSTRRIMMGYAHAFADAGLVTASLDLRGHGSNPLPLDPGGDGLPRDVESARALLTNRPDVDPERIAVLGHSMGSGAAMRSGIEYADRIAAVIAVSPTDAIVTPELPANLLLQAGEWEPGFVANARELLAAAGGARTGQDAFVQGIARDLVVIPRREHITIVFSERSRETAVAWLSAALADASVGDVQTAARPYPDRRSLFFLVQLAGWVLVCVALRPALRRLVPGDAARGARGLPALRGRTWAVLMIAAAPIAAAAVWGLTFVTDVAGAGGMLVAGAVVMVLALYGLIWLPAGVRPARPRARSLALGVGLFALLWLAIGLPSQWVALQWVLIPSRLARWPLAALALLPASLAIGYVEAGTGPVVRMAIFVSRTISIVAVLFGLGLLEPSLFVLALFAPAVPLLFGAQSAGGALFDDPWATAVGSALFIGWAIVATFPLAA